jgi:peptidoglycan/xylan/chitin deacetylase (PgdA/CDA1 family)
MLLNLLYKTGFFDLSRTLFKNKKSISILLHGTYASNFQNIPDKLHFGMHTNDLEQMIVWLKKENIPIITTEELLEGKPGLNISLDDGYANNFEHGLKVFEKTETPFTIYVTTRHMIKDNQCEILDYFQDIIHQEKVHIPDEVGYELFWGLTPDQLKKLSIHQLVELGCHTHNHQHLNKCSDAEIDEEIKTSTLILQNNIGFAPDIFSYPFGDYDERVINSVTNNGYKAAFAVNPTLYINKRYEIPRIGIYSASSAYLSAKLNFIYRTI